MLSVELFRRHVIAAKCGSMAIFVGCGGVWETQGCPWLCTATGEMKMEEANGVARLADDRHRVGSIPAHTK